MSTRQAISYMQPFDYLQCKRCNSILPISAVFCGKCGVRIDKDETHSSDTSLSGQNDIAARYRITSLVRRRPSIQLSFAFDTQLQRFIMLRDIDISGLDKAAKELARAELQQEYDLLRRQHITDVTPLIAAYSYEGHLYSAAGWPFPLDEKEAAISSIPSRRPYTLHDLLQSGIGLPKEQVASSWIGGLALAVECLHERQIIVGELDPDTIIVSSHDYSGQPALTVSWIPATVRHALSQAPNTAYSSSFRAPETLHGQEDGLTDIYSLGALLYLLLTGSAPDPIGSPNPKKRYPLYSPRDLNPHISSALDAIVMQALALEPDKRFQHASELGEALLHLEKKPHIIRWPQTPFARPPKSTPKPVEETLVSSGMDNNESNISKEARPIEEPSGETIQTRELAQRYLSKINTNALSSHEKPIGEATVDEIQIQEEQTEDVTENEYMQKQTAEEISVNKGNNAKRGKKRSNKKYRAVDGNTPEVAGRAEVQDETIPATVPSPQVVEVSEESSNKVPPQEVADGAPTEEVVIVSSSEDMAEVEFPSELAESEQSVEEASQQEASVDVQQSQDTAARETTQQEGVESDHEAITQQAERVEPDQEATQQEGVEPDQEEAPQQEASVDVEQPQDTAARETTQQEEVESDHEAITQQAKQVESDQEATQQEGVESDQEVTLQQEGIEPDQEVTLLQELLQLGQERVEPEQEVTLQQERVEPDASQEERAVPTSQALLPQSTSRPGMLSALLPGISKERALIRIKDLFIGIRSSLTHQIQPTGGDANKDASFLQRVQRFILGEQKHTTMAVALIETPMRIQPTQNYAIRIQIIGRDQLEDEAQTGGLSALSHGDVVHIEVRLALYQSYAYMVQQADVAIPASGYAAEVTVPMHPLSSGPSSRRERLHIFFMDRERNPLYEKPFVIELFVSPLVQLGHEGHNVLSIPI